MTKFVADSELLCIVPNFDIFQRDREGRHGGSVMLATHCSLTCSLINIATSIAALFPFCNTSYLPIIFGICYRPPDAKPSFIVSLHELLCSVTCTHRDTPHTPSINWLYLLSSTSRNNEECEFLNTFGLTQVILEPARDLLIKVCT